MPVYDMSKNPVTEAGFELGKKIFYDGKLSRDGTISCAECHAQSYAFTHHGHTLSHGIDNRIGTRNAPPIQNTAFMRSFFWDGGVFDLDLFPIAPITNPVEMDEELGNVLKKLRADPAYTARFKEAYGSEEITTERFLKALSQFMNALISDNSKYDKYIRKETGGEMSADELEGLALFKQKCSSCHQEPLFSDEKFHNNGLDISFRDIDYGRYNITGERQDRYTFKTPSLRNIAFTAPYMHDGRFNTLEDVLNHYQNDMSYSLNLDPVFFYGDNKRGIEMTDDEKSKIILFLKTLSDKEFITDKRFAAPN